MVQDGIRFGGKAMPMTPPTPRHPHNYDCLGNISTEGLLWGQPSSQNPLMPTWKPKIPLCFLGLHLFPAPATCSFFLSISKNSTYSWSDRIYVKSSEILHTLHQNWFCSLPICGFCSISCILLPKGGPGCVSLILCVPHYLPNECCMNEARLARGYHNQIFLPVSQHHLEYQYFSICHSPILTLRMVTCLWS